MGGGLASSMQATYDQTALCRRFSVVAGALVEISGEFFYTSVGIRQNPLAQFTSGGRLNKVNKVCEWCNIVTYIGEEWSKIEFCSTTSPRIAP